MDSVGCIYAYIHACVCVNNYEKGDHVIESEENIRAVERERME